MLKASALFLAILAQAAYSQPRGDSARAVTLSERIGPVISAADARRYHLFSSVAGFSSARVVQLRDSSYEVVFRMDFASGSESDTAVAYPRTTIYLLAEKIDHFEELENGTYVMGSSPPVLHHGDEWISVPPANRATAPNMPPPAKVIPARADRSLDLLPLHVVPGLSMPESFPSLSLGICISSNNPDFTGLESAYGGRHPFSVTPLGLFSVEIHWIKEIATQMDAGESFGGSDRMDVLDIALIVYARPFASPNIRPFAGIGAAWASLHADEQSVVTEAGGSGMYLTGGLELVLGTKTSIDLFASYSSIEKVSSEFLGVNLFQPVIIPVSVNLSSFRLGLRLKFL
ncbi:MAG TPA: hypothetical protein VL126_14005 [Bacteroidota bacterium]|nr:hypothetical protein [Bacteroidota bacterium]